MRERTRARETRMYRVYTPGQSRHRDPAMVVDAATADYWLGCGWAINLGKGKIALKETHPLRLRGQSCMIRESTILASLDGSKYHASLIQCWR